MFAQKPFARIQGLADLGLYLNQVIFFYSKTKWRLMGSAGQIMVKISFFFIGEKLSLLSG